jgi:plasmid stabilization system protein ParE
VIPARFHAAALEELEAEVSYYTEISPMLGEGLLRSVEQALQLACEFPEMGAPYKHGTRRVFPKRFPLALVYLHRNGEVYVVALAPFRRKPAYWKSRRNEG